MSSLKWQRLSALGGLRVIYNGTLDGKLVAQVAVTYRATLYSGRSGVLPRVKQYSVWGGGSFRTLREAKLEAERTWVRRSERGLEPSVPAASV
jgi:hypothetical protein